MSDNEVIYIVNCKDTMFRVQFFVDLLAIRKPNLDKTSEITANRLFFLCAALPNIPGGVLFELASGELDYVVDHVKETLMIIKKEESNVPI